MTDATLYMVGGAVRDMIMGTPNPKDIDFAVEAESFKHMEQWMVENGFDIFIKSPQYFTIRARSPKSGFEFAGKNYEGLTFDFALCRTDGEYSDGRRPDSVEVGTILTDLARRDFTMNAIAMDASGAFLDPFGGRDDILDGSGLIRCVGGTERLVEDGLRVMRALRFSAQLGFDMDQDVHDFLESDDATQVLRNTETERIRQELAKAFKLNSYWTIKLLAEYGNLAHYIFTETDIWLEATRAKK